LYVVGLSGTASTSGFFCRPANEGANSVSATRYGLGAGIFFSAIFSVFKFLKPGAGARRRPPLDLRLDDLLGHHRPACMFSVFTPAASFISLRFLLGAAEAGFLSRASFLPSLLVPRQRKRPSLVALFHDRRPRLRRDRWPDFRLALGLEIIAEGLAGWQWMFLSRKPFLQSCSVSLPGFFLRDNPGAARPGFLSGKILASCRTLDGEASLAIGNFDRNIPGLWFVNPRLWGFALVYFGLNTCTYGISLLAAKPP